MATGTATRKTARTTCVMLACRRWRVGDMACSGCVYARNAIESVACDRARILSRDRISLLVAGSSTLAECLKTAGLVDRLVPLSRHVAVRCPFRISCVLRTRRISRLPVDIGPIQPYCSRRSAVRRCVDVDLRHDCLSGGWSDLQHEAAHAAELRGDNGSNSNLCRRVFILPNLDAADRAYAREDYSCSRGPDAEKAH